MRQFVRELSYPQYDVSQDSHHAVPAKATCVSAEAGPSSNAHNARVVALRVPFGLLAGLPDCPLGRGQPVFSPVFSGVIRPDRLS